MVRLPPIIRRWLTLSVVVVIFLFIGIRFFIFSDRPPFYDDNYSENVGLWDGVLGILRLSEEQEYDAPLGHVPESLDLLLWSLVKSRRVEALPLTEDERTIQTHLRAWDFSELVNPPQKTYDIQNEDQGVDQAANPDAKKNQTFSYPIQNRFPIIVWWTPFTGNKHIVRACGRGRCLFSHNRNLRDHPKTRAFMWYGTDLKFRDLPLPRGPKHDWALLHEESPKNNWPIVHEPVISLFNHTCTFRRESSYPISLQYLPSIKYLMEPPQFSLLEKNQFIKEEGLAPVLYIQSDCDVPSDRDRYVKEFMKYIKVDSLGKCLHNRDLPEEFVDPLTMDDKGFHRIIAKYKFALSLENAICKDYMTEKLWRPLNLGSVPIYKGSPSVQDWMPNNHTIILVDDFSSVEALADYIKYLDDNDDEYARYLDYKDQKKFTNSMLTASMKTRPWGIDGYDSDGTGNFIDGFECHVCDRIYEELLAEATGKKPVVFQANQSHYGCPRPTPAISGMAPDFYLRTWINEYERSSAIIALAAQRMVESGANSSRKLNQFIEKVFNELQSENFDTSKVLH